MDTESTLKLMDETKQNYQEFIRNRRLISRFDPHCKEKVVKKQLGDSHNHKDYTRINILKIQNNEALVKSIVKQNFKKIFDQNLPKLVQETGLPRQDVINLYTRFVSIYMLQQLDNPQYEGVELSELRRINLDMIASTSKSVKLQSSTVV